MIDLILNSGLKKEAKRFNFNEFYVNEKDFILIKENNAEKLKKEIKEAKKIFNLVLIEGNENINRDVCESEDLILLSPWKGNGRLNQVLCKFANKNNTAICFSFNEILEKEGRYRSILLNRIKETIKLCRKYKVKTILATFASGFYELRNSFDLIRFLVTLGMHPKEAKEAFTNVLEIERRNKEKKSKEFVSEGVKIVKYLK